MPRIVPSTPCARLNRPVPVVRSVTTKRVNTVTAAPVTPSSNCTTSINIGSDTNANSSERAASIAKPASSSGLRPHNSDQYPIHGAKMATTTWGTTIRPPMNSELLATLLCARFSLTRGSSEALQR